MALVFLDTEHLSLLEKARRTEPAGYASFLNAWKGLGCTLVFTLAQAAEVRRYENSSGREGRYQVLAELAPVRTDFTQHPNDRPGPRILIEREILRAAVLRGLLTVTGPGADGLLQEWMDPFPGHFDANEARTLRAIESEEFLSLVSRERVAAQHAATAMKHERQIRKELRLRDLPDGPLPAEIALACRKEIEKVAASIEERFRGGSSPPTHGEAAAAVIHRIREFLTRTERIGRQAALLEQLQVAGSTKEELPKLKGRELVERHWFQVVARSFARDVLNVTADGEESLVRTLALADCPGSWLQKRLELSVRRDSSEPRPNHHYDCERLAYLPYVDLLLTDREMAGFVRQIQDNESTPQLIRDLPPPLSVASAMDALENAIDSHSR